MRLKTDLEKMNSKTALQNYFKDNADLFDYFEKIGARNIVSVAASVYREEIYNFEFKKRATDFVIYEYPNIPLLKMVIDRNSTIKQAIDDINQV